MSSRAIVLALTFLALPASATAPVPVLRSSSITVTVEAPDEKGPWTLKTEKPNVIQVEVPAGKRHTYRFISDGGSVEVPVEAGKASELVIEVGGVAHHVRIDGTRPAAVFDQRYQARHRGRVSVEIPEVYELVNVAIAVTPTGIDKPDLVFQRSDYYTRMRRWFDRHRDHPLVAKLDTELKEGHYGRIKANAYALEFDGKGRIVPSKVYDRIHRWRPSNPLLPFLADLQSFADATRFRRFYRANAPLYREQIAFYRDRADVAGMKRWLHRNFPDSKDFDTVKVIFSPLVAYSQESIEHKSNGFSELQPHVNFPYPVDFQGLKSERAATVARGNIVFTEMNHGYIWSYREKHLDRILKATGNRDHWVDRAKIGDSYRGGGLFDEYMNWGLVTLRVVDHVPAEEQAELIERVERMMVERRGFRQFAAFDQALLALYRGRQPQQPVAELYPRIIEWFERNQPPQALPAPVR